MRGLNERIEHYAEKPEPCAVTAADDTLRTCADLMSNEIAITRNHRGVCPVLGGELAA